MLANYKILINAFIGERNHGSSHCIIVVAKHKKNMMYISTVSINIF